MKRIIILTLMILLISIFRVNADSGGYIVKFLTNINIDSRFEMLFGNTYYTNDLKNLNGLEKYIEYVEPNDDVELIEPINKRTKFLQRNSDGISETENWQSEMVKADFAWELATYGNGVNVAVIDSGCNRHIDIVDSLAGGHNYILDTDDYSDNIGHGTHVAGIIAAGHNGFGIMGVAPKVNIYALKCFDSNYQTTVSMLAKAIRSAVDDYNCKIINMSLGLKNDRETLHEAIQYATEKGVIIIAAVGNDGDEKIYYPAGYDEVIGVGSVGITKELSNFSQLNDSVFVVAPGESFESLKGKNAYTNKEGTSQAAPLVAAAAAVLLCVDNDMTLSEFKGYIINGSEPLEGTYSGYGLLNIEEMFKLCIKQESYYVSPFSEDGVVIYNNTDTALCANGIFASYNNQRFTSCEIKEVELQPKEKVRLNPLNHEGALKFFLWESMQNLKPLAEERIGGIKK